jgi:hypothetical protein
MKKTIKQITLLLAALCVLASCEHTQVQETVVHPDGSLDKTLIAEVEDKDYEILALDSARGWTKEVLLLDSSSNQESKSKKYRLTFRKHFASAEEANQDLAIPSDTLFRITSSFQKEYRWFYTYIRYSDTYHALNRLKLPVTNYLTPEDSAFMLRLPAEGKPINQADSLYLASLNERLFDVYGLHALFEEYMDITRNVMAEQQVDKSWMDSLQSYQPHLLHRLEHDNSVDDHEILHLLDSLKFPLDYTSAQQQFDSMGQSLEQRTGFISFANEGKYTNVIHMPWEVTDTNADSIAGRSLYWHPPVIKFIVTDYTMYAEARTLNWWAIAISLVIVGFTGYLFLRKRIQS